MILEFNQLYRRNKQRERTSKIIKRGSRIIKRGNEINEAGRKYYYLRCFFKERLPSADSKRTF